MKTTSFFALATTTTFALALALGGASSLGACSDPATGTDASTSDAQATDSSTTTGDAQSTTDSSTGTDASTGDAGGLTPEEKKICDARASHETCPGVSTGQGCDESTKCLYARIAEPAAVDAYATCYASPSCKGDDACIELAGETVGGRAATAYATACVDKANECGADFPSKELCTPAAFAYKGVGAAAAACLAKPCADQKACFDAAVKPIVDCKAL
jgi:hypothetical protein